MKNKIITALCFGSVFATDMQSFQETRSPIVRFGSSPRMLIGEGGLDDRSLIGTNGLIGESGLGFRKF